MTQQLTTTSNRHLELQQQSNVLLNLPSGRQTKENVFKAVQVAVATVIADLNSKEVSNMDLDYLINNITDFIIKSYPSIRIEEIKEAFSRGVRNEYGPYYGLSVVTLEGFIKGYFNSEHRLKLFKALPDPFIPTEPSEEEKFETAKSNTLNTFNSFKKQNDIRAIAPTIYNFLDSIQLLNYTNSEKFEFIEDAKINLVKMLSSKIGSTIIKNERTKLSNTLESIQMGGEKSKVITEAKHVGLISFFRYIELNDSDLEELINNNKHHFMKGPDND